MTWLFNYLIAFTSLHNSYIVREFVIKSTKTPFFLLDLLAQKVFFTKATDWSNFLLKKTGAYYCFLVHHIFLWTLSPCLQFVSSRRSKLRASMWTLLPLFTNSPNTEKFCFSFLFLPFLLFCFYFFVYWDKYRKSAGFDKLKPLKKYQPDHLMKQTYKSLLLVISSSGSVPHKSLTGVYFWLCISFSTKEQRVCLIDHREWYLPLWHSREKKFDLKKFIPNISEEFTVVINLTPSNAWFERLSLRPSNLVSVKTKISN